MKIKIATVAFAALVSLLSPAFAGTYEDDVFRRGEPRAGGKPWLHEDRNVRPAPRVIIIRSAAPCCQQQTVRPRPRMRVVHPAPRQRAVAAPCCTPTAAPVAAPVTASAPATFTIGEERSVAQVVGMVDGKFCFIDNKGTRSYTSVARAVGTKFRVGPGGVMYW